ncbi:MAG: hypothetical protein ABL982_24110, partial [Vicinamibacterales bacterium]
GELIFILLVSIVDAAILSWMALYWYRRTVARIMSRPPRHGVSPVPPASVPVGAADRARTTIPVAQLRRRLTIAYLAGILAFAAITGTAMVVAAQNLVPAAFVSLIWAHAWPIWPVLTLLLAYDRARSARVLTLYLLGGAGAIILVTLIPRLLRGTMDLVPFSNVYWAVASLLVVGSAPLLVLALISIRRVRAVMPLALSGTIVFGIGLTLFRRLVIVGFNDITFRSAMLSLAGWSSTGVAYYGLYFVAAIPLAWCAWKVLQRIAHAYARKRFSDAQILVDCWFASIAAATIAVDLLTPFGFLGFAIGGAAFAAYRITVLAVLRLVPITAPDPSSDGLRLLMLRVFGFQHRTELLFDRLSRDWRFHGPVQLIGGPDLATRTVDAGEVLSFLEGRLEEQYVSSLESVPARMNSLDLARDPDGRFRVNDIYCLNDTWQAMFLSMLSVTDRVVMDLRGFSPTRAGCRFELEQLVLHVPADRIVLVTDATTDVALLTQIVTAPVVIVPVERDLAEGVSKIVSSLLRPAMQAPATLSA